MLDFEADEPLRFLPCKHGYHVACIDDWLLRSFTCPSCMEPVDSALLSAFTAAAGVVDLAALRAEKPQATAGPSSTTASHLG